MVSVCFVCLGNICRSPTAEGVMRHLVEQAGLLERIRIDSAGTGSWHVGEAPDRRSTATACRRGIVLAGRARQFKADDWRRFDYVVALDEANHRDLMAACPEGSLLAKLSLLRDFDPESPPGSSVPDPYYGGDGGFDEVLDLCEAACRHLLMRIRQDHEL